MRAVAVAVRVAVKVAVRAATAMVEDAGGSEGNGGETSRIAGPS